MSDTPPTSPTNPKNTSSAGQQAPATPAAGARSFFGAASQQLDDWLAIEPDGTVTVYSGKVELGTGVHTALARLSPRNWMSRSNASIW